MNKSFYNGAIGARAQQMKFDVIGNNLANSSTTGFKARQVVFSDLLYSNINAEPGTESKLKAGSAIRLEKADTLFTQGALIPSDQPLDFAIKGAGFFALQDPETQEVTYTRDGSFNLSLKPDDTFYLVSKSGKFVLDNQGEPIQMKKKPLVPVNEAVEGAQDIVVGIMIGGETFEEIFGKDPFEGAMLDTENVRVGLYDFPNKNGMESLGDGEYRPIEKNGEPFLLSAERDKIQKGALEGSNVEEAKEFTDIIETQRAYQLALRMVQTSDEIENLINSLR